jgi:uncharacterized protein YjbJ (UPF0337 family)
VRCQTFSAGALSRTEGDWKQITGNIKRRFGRLVETQLDLWSGKREPAKRAGDERVREREPGTRK